MRRCRLTLHLAPCVLRRNTPVHIRANPFLRVCLLLSYVPPNQNRPSASCLFFTVCCAGTKQFPTCTTGTNGRCNVLVSSGIPGPMTSSASVTGQNGQPLTEQAPLITWVAPGTPSPSPSPSPAPPNTERLTIAATPNQVPVNGSVTVSATYTVNGVPTAGKLVTFEVVRPDGTKINPTCTTTAAGEGGSWYGQLWSCGCMSAADETYVQHGDVQETQLPSSAAVNYCMT
jgi:hypothetical protein